MPLIVPSHQAAVLPLLSLRTTRLSGLGLVLGSAAPDLVFILSLDESGVPASHTLLGQLWITVPLALAVHGLATRLVLPWLLPHLPAGAPFHFHALARARPMATVGSLARVAASALVGSLTHIALDGFTHGDESGWALPLLPGLATQVPTPFGSMHLYDVLQLLSSIGLGAVAIVGWHRLAQRLPRLAPGAAAVWEVRPAPRGARRRVAALFLGAALLGLLAPSLLKSSIASQDQLKLAAYGAVAAVSATAVIAPLVAALRRRLG